MEQLRSEPAARALGQSALQGHLATLEAHLMVTTGARMLSLVALAGGFAQARTRPTPEALGGWLAARSRS